MSLHHITDLLIGFSYIAIAAMLVYLVRRGRGNIPFRPMFLALAAFLVACAGTYFLAVVVPHRPFGWLASYVTAITAMASVTTAVAVAAVIPRLLLVMEARQLSEERTAEQTKVAEKLILERRLTEDALHTSEKQAIVGRMAAAIAHEINNPLESLTNLLFLLDEHTSAEGPARQYLQMAQQEVGRIAHITKQTLGFYRESAEPVPVRLSEVLESVLGMLAHRAALRKVSMEREFREPSEVRGFPVEMRQVFTNLVSNALDAVGHNGRIRIRIAPGRNWRNPQIRGVRVLVADNGHGIPPEIQRKIFEPFFTTKSERGTGLGLWVSGSILHKHGGSVRVRSSVRPGRSGTCFSVFLPIETAAAQLRVAG